MRSHVVGICRARSPHCTHASTHTTLTCTHGTPRRLEVVSDRFDGLPAVRRHQLVYGLLGEEFSQGLHALSMSCKTAQEAGRQ